jgi:hypothetical protein
MAQDGHNFMQYMNYLVTPRHAADAPFFLIMTDFPLM